MKIALNTEIRNLFTEYLIKNGHRQTKERYAILEHVYAIDGHFDVEGLYISMLEEKKFHVSRATIYNTIELLVEAHLVVRHQFGTIAVQYERSTAAETHYHLVCSHCGNIREYKDDNLMQIVKNKKITKFTPEYYSLYIYGLCSKCKYALKRKGLQ